MNFASNYANTRFTLLDPDKERRSEVASVFKPLVKNVIQHEGLDQLLSNWPLTGVVLIYDSATLVADLQQAMRNKGNWRTHVAFNEAASTTNVVEAVVGGAIDYLDWPVSETELLPRMKLWRSRSGPLALREVRKTRARKRIGLLSPREIQFLKLLASGKSGPHIAELLEISRRTVEIHRANTFKKLNVSNAAAAARLAVEAELWLQVPLDRARRTRSES